MDGNLKLDAVSGILLRGSIVVAGWLVFVVEIAFEANTARGRGDLRRSADDEVFRGGHREVRGRRRRWLLGVLLAEEKGTRRF